MAVESFSRWQTYRDITLHKRSGILTLQIGRNYLCWNIHSAKIVSISSTLPEFTFSFFLLQRGIDADVISRNAKLVTDHKPLAAVLVEKQVMEIEEARQLLCEHAFWVSEQLFRGTSVFWNSVSSPPKRHALKLEMPFNDPLLRCDRNDLDTSWVLRVVNGLKPPLRVISEKKLDSVLITQEKRVLAHLNASSSLKEIMSDSELDTFSVYRTLFLLWITGLLQDGSERTRVQKHHQPANWVQRIRSIPPDWIFPLIAGSLIGALLVPSGGPKEPAPSTYHIEPLQKALDRPSWKDSEEKTREANRRAAEDAE